MIKGTCLVQAGQISAETEAAWLAAHDAKRSAQHAH